MFRCIMSVAYSSVSNEVTIIDDTKETIDYVLVRKVSKELNEDILVFERNLKKHLILEETHEKGKVFIKITVKEDTLEKYCELLKIRMPLKEIGEDKTDSSTSISKKIYKFIIHFGFSERIFPDKAYKLTEAFSRCKKDLFNTNDTNFFTPSVKSMIIHFVLSTTIFSNEEVGISKLLEQKHYEATYPVHDKWKRSKLVNEFASLMNLKNALKKPPLDDIKDYLGIKIALYYTWMSFYSRMLIPASIIGILFMLYGVITYFSRLYKFEACSANFIMCPLCDKNCDYWEINDSCAHTIITYVFDNSSTVIFAVIMTLWSAIYSNMWKRLTAQIKHRWGMNCDFVLDEDDKFENKFHRVPKIVFSFVIVLFLILILIAITLSLIFYRVSITAAEGIFGEDLTQSKKLIITISGSIIEFVSIRIMNHYFNKIAVWLTRKENHRTPDNFEFHLAWKMFLFGFVNYYSALFYIAFIKGRFGGRPGKHTRLFGYRQEECDPGGCMLELFIQSAVIMIGDFTLYNFLEYIEPYIERKFRTRRKIPATSHSDIYEETQSLDKRQQFIKDYALLDWQPTHMIQDYLDMVLQYGLVTLFITAFPLAPLFALINNIFEMRMDAKNLLTNYRRPVAQNSNNIGIWLWIMDFLAKCAILSNACIIAFTSNFIPQLVYTLHISPNRTAAGFLNYSLSYFDVRDFERNTEPKATRFNVTECRYPDYRNSPGHANPYEITMFYWHVLVARLAFVVGFTNAIVVLKMIWKCLVPEMPRKLKEHILSETRKAQTLLQDAQSTNMTRL